MAMRIVYRMEHRETMEGPFQGPGCIWSAPDYSAWTHPGINHDLDNGIDDAEVCGVGRIDLIDHWFRFEREHLKRNGYRIHAFLVDSEHVRDAGSGYQLVFTRCRAKDLGSEEYHAGWKERLTRRVKSFKL